MQNLLKTNTILELKTQIYSCMAYQGVYHRTS